MSSLIDEGLRYHNAGDLEKAEKSYLDAVFANSSDAQALKLLAVVQAERGQFDDAVSYAAAAVNLLPDDSECTHLLGRIHIERGEFEAAVPVLREATQKAGSSASAIWADFGLCLERTGAWPKAKDAFAQVLKLEPDHRGAVHGAARVAQALGELDLSEEFFKCATVTDPKDAEAWVGLAKVEQERGNLDAALKHAEHAYSIAPASVPCVVTRDDLRAALSGADSAGAGTNG